MHRLEYKLGKKVLPREHFDLIAAVDSSRQVIHESNMTFLINLIFKLSPIAVFLGLFGMSVEEAQKTFYDLYSAVFKNKKESPKKRALILENQIKKILDALKLPHTTRMSDLSSPDSSKVYVVMLNAYLISI